LDAVHPSTIPTLARKLQVDAINGDYDAMRILLDYSLGRPAQQISLSDAEGGPLGPSFVAIQAVILDALADDPARRFELATKLMELDDARITDADS
jgi:hypothetical protein